MSTALRKSPKTIISASMTKVTDDPFCTALSRYGTSRQPGGSVEARGSRRISLLHNQSAAEVVDVAFDIDETGRHAIIVDGYISKRSRLGNDTVVFPYLYIGAFD